MDLDPRTPCPCGRPRQTGLTNITANTKSNTKAHRPGNPASTAPAAPTTTARYADCCARWHAGPTHLQAPDAESLMRSRYSAFALGLADYLLATWHPSTRPATLPLEGPELRWLGLAVKRHLQQDEDHATVAFVARSKQGGRAHRLEETSRFVREHEAAGARWYYLNGDLNGDPNGDPNGDVNRHLNRDLHGDPKLTSTSP